MVCIFNYGSSHYLESMFMVKRLWKCCKHIVVIKIVFYLKAQFIALKYKHELQCWVQNNMSGTINYCMELLSTNWT